MAGTGHPRSRPPTRGRGSGRTTKSTPARKKRVQSSDDEADKKVKSPEPDTDDDQSEVATPKPSTRTSRSKNNTLSDSKWAIIDQETEVDDIESDPHTEEEDELVDEGDDVDSDIEKLNTSSPGPLQVQCESKQSYFISSLRYKDSFASRTGITLQTPPTPSPTKTARKRQAPQSPEVVDLVDNSAEDSDVIPSNAPTKSSKTRTRKVVKSKEIIEDSDVEECSDVEPEIIKKGKGRQMKTLPVKSSRSAVTEVTKKIAVRGTSFPSAPIEDADNNLFLDNNSSLSRSPKKKVKMSRPSDSEDDTSNVDVASEKSGPVVSNSPVSKITSQLNDSVLNSAKKSKATTTKAYDARLKKFAVSLGLDSVGAYFCPAMIGTYADVFQFPVQGISLCFGDSIFWYRLGTLFMGVGIKERSKQEKELVQLITTPQLTPFIINPARCNPNDFRLVTPSKETVGSKRPYLVHASNGKRVVCAIFGRVDASSLLDLQQMGQSGYYNRSLSLCPIAVEYTLAWSFFATLLNVDRVNNYGGHANFSTFGTREHSDRDAIGYKHQDVAPPPRPRAPRASVAVHTVGVDHEDSLLQTLKRGMDNGGLDSFSEVFNVSSFYGPLSTTEILHDTERFIAMCAQNESTYNHVDHVDLQFNLVGVVLLAAKFGQGAGNS
ncbi:hypothetical protein BDY19DRAFT_998359 [Irpex rosettiformis]|uniref:Uncharacterized protein n=1 Tax=Irpex rosettiformis TaxID=378272 RepID=A0ACB8TNU0_9APHY|nr:hypothetical protein BDY19DRAFT_998359 [Irpex rosettiformis]